MPTVKAKKTSVKKVVAKKVVKPVVKVAPKTPVVKKASAVKPVIVRSGGLSVAMFDIKGAKAGTIVLPKEIFGAKINEPLMAQAVRVYLANQRQGNASTLTRGEVTGSTRKIYKQKGTGNARHGGKRAPIFVKGGVAHGPHPKDYSLSLPQKMRRAALYSALSLRVKDGDIKVLSGLSKVGPKTKEMSLLVKKITEDKKAKNSILLITSNSPKGLVNIYKSARNISNVEILSANLLNTYEVLKYKNVLLMKESIDILQGGIK